MRTLMISSRFGLSSAMSSSILAMRPAGDVCAHSPRPLFHDLTAASSAFSESSSLKRAWWPMRIFSSESGCGHRARDRVGEPRSRQVLSEGRCDCVQQRWWFERLPVRWSADLVDGCEDFLDCSGPRLDLAVNESLSPIHHWSSLVDRHVGWLDHRRSESRPVTMWFGEVRWNMIRECRRAQYCAAARR